LYNGIREVDVTEEELARFYEKNLEYELNPNQYLLLKRDGITNPFNDKFELLETRDDIYLNEKE